MSALDGWIDILRTGTFRDMRGTEATFGADDLDAIATATLAADPAPVVVGHPDADAPAYAWIEGVRRVGDRLQARLRDIDGAFRTAVEAGRYTGRSIALVADADGAALRIRHLGFLGGRAPAVAGLAPTQFAGAGAAVRTYEFAADDMQRSVYRVVADTFRAIREWIIERDGAEQADRIVPDWRLGILADAGREDLVALAATHNPPETGGTGAPERSTQPPVDATGADGRAGAVSDPPNPPEDADMSGTSGAGTGATETDLAARAAALDAREAVLAARESRRAAADAVAPHVEAGRVLPAERAGLEAFLAALPEGEGATELVFAAADGAEVRTPPRRWFLDFVAALPRRVDYREIAGADTRPPQSEREFDARTAETDARAAREYIRLAAERGEHVTIIEAVDLVRRQREQGGQ